MPCPPLSHLFDILNNFRWAIEVMKLLIMSFSPVSYHFLSLCTNIFSALFELPQSVVFPQCARPSFTPIKTTGNIIVLYILIFIFLDSEQEDRRSTEWFLAFPDFDQLLLCETSIYRRCVVDVFALLWCYAAYVASRLTGQAVRNADSQLHACAVKRSCWVTKASFPSLNARSFDVSVSLLRHLNSLSALNDGTRLMNEIFTAKWQIM